MFNTNDLKTGMTIQMDGNIFTVLETGHVKPGKGAAFVTAKLKNLRTGSIIEERFNAGTKVEAARIEKRDMQYLYEMNDIYYFMNMETYDQIELNVSSLGDDAKFLKENLIVSITSYEGEVIGISLPDKIEYQVTHSEPAVKGNTSSGAMKDATLENGMTIKVPLFIEEGETILVTTKDGKYASRA
ncbi:MAG: elongation factor P [bacterium]|nr:elongation factor P [bacterium]